MDQQVKEYKHAFRRIQECLAKHGHFGISNLKDKHDDDRRREDKKIDKPGDFSLIINQCA